jgi:hypothetical protein
MNKETLVESFKDALSQVEKMLKEERTWEARELVPLVATLTAKLEVAEKKIKSYKDDIANFNRGWEAAKNGEPKGCRMDDELHGWEVFHFDDLEARLKRYEEGLGDLRSEIDEDNIHEDDCDEQNCLVCMIDELLKEQTNED